MGGLAGGLRSPPGLLGRWGCLKKRPPKRNAVVHLLLVRRICVCLCGSPAYHACLPPHRAVMFVLILASFVQDSSAVKS